MELQNFDSREQMSRAAVKITAELFKKQVDLGKTFSIALSGGRSPVLYYQLLAEAGLDWSKVTLFIVDERKVLPSHQDSNVKMIRESLLSKIEMPEHNIFLPDTTIENPEECAEEYELRLRNHFGTNAPVITLVVLGVGPDGHTASLFPGANIGLDSERLIIATKAPEQFAVADRISMTMNFINNSHMRMFVISGEGKLEMIQRTMSADKTIPAGHIKDPCLILTSK